MQTTHKGATEMQNKSTFTSWMAEVDAALEAKCMMDSRDLADCPYHDWYDDGVRPRAAATRAIRETVLRNVNPNA